MNNRSMEGALLYAGLYLIAFMEFSRVVDCTTVLERDTIAAGEQNLRVVALQLQFDALETVAMVCDTTFQSNRESVLQEFYAMTTVGNSREGKGGDEGGQLGDALLLEADALVDMMTDECL